MQHETIPPVAKRALAIAFAIAGFALLVSPGAGNLWTEIICVIGGILLLAAAVLTFAETNNAEPQPHIMSGPELLADRTQPIPVVTVPEPAATPAAPAAPVAPAAPAQPSVPTVSTTSVAQKSKDETMIETLRRMMIRSQDAVATLRELAAFDSESALPVALTATGVTELTNAPVFECGHLRRSRRFWFHLDLESTEPDDYDVLTSAEATLNTYQDALLSPAGTDDVRERMRQVFTRVPLAVYEAEAQWLPPQPSKEMSGEWGTRVRFAEFCENLRLPFRMAFDFDVNLREGAFEVTANTPRPRCFAFLGYNESECADAARAYAAELAGVLAQGAFDTNERIANVQVFLHEQGSGEVILALPVTRADLGSGRMTSYLGKGFDEPREAGAIIVNVDDNGWLAPLEGEYNRFAELFTEADRLRPVELIQGEAPHELALACGVRTYSDLGMNEDIGRKSAWSGLEKTLDGTMSTAVKSLVELRDKTDDLTVAEAANRLADALVNDTVDVEDTEAMERTFVWGTSLDRACVQARRAIDQDDEFEMEAAVARLEGELAPLMETGLYFDDDVNVYRYFNSIAERIAYNLTMDDGTRTVRIVPDAYYSAHSLALRIHGALGHYGLALAHAEELCRMAPATADATLAKVRVLEDESQIIEAAELLKELISWAPTHRDMSVAFYRLAYMEWKLGRSDLSVACYERAIELYPASSQQSLSELEDLLASDDTLTRLGSDQIEAKLAEGGIPYGDSYILLERLGRAAHAVTDANLMSIAWQVAGAYADGKRDDVTVDVYRSLRPVS